MSSIRRCAVRNIGAAVILLLLVACTSLPDQTATVIPPESWPDHLAAAAAIDVWSLGGRLNIRQGNQSDTVNLNWAQQQDSFDINISGALGLGAVHLQGTPALVTLAKAGEETLVLSSLDDLTRDMLGYDFPADHLLWWVRGLPAPGMPAQPAWNDAGLLATLQQTDASGKAWSLAFDRYDNKTSPALPGRISARQGTLQLTFLVSDWQLTGATP
jgi:outer membrane lipoprotein LolB